MFPAPNRTDTPSSYWNRLTPAEKIQVREYQRNSVIASMTIWLLNKGCMSGSFERESPGPAIKRRAFSYGRSYHRRIG